MLQTPMFEKPRADYRDIEALKTFITEDWSALKHDFGKVSWISGPMIDQFGALTCNHQWIHEELDLVAQTQSPYGARIAHGLLLVSLIPGLLPDDFFVLTGHSVRIVRGMDRLRLPSPAYVGDQPWVRAKIRDVYAAPSGKGTVIERDVEMWLFNRWTEKPTVSCILKLQYF